MLAGGEKICRIIYSMFLKNRKTTFRSAKRFMSEILAAGISALSAVTVGILALIGVIITGNRSGREIEQKLQTAQAVTDTKIEELTREVRQHNNFAERVPILEQKIKSAEYRISNIENLQSVSHRI